MPVPPGNCWEFPIARSLRWNGHLHVHICWTVPTSTLSFLVLNILFSTIALCSPHYPNTHILSSTLWLPSVLFCSLSLFPCLAPIKLPACPSSGLTSPSSTFLVRAYFYSSSTVIVKTFSLHSSPPLQIAFLISLHGYFKDILKQSFHYTYRVICVDDRSSEPMLQPGSFENWEARHFWKPSPAFSPFIWWWWGLLAPQSDSFYPSVCLTSSPTVYLCCVLSDHTGLLSVHPACFPPQDSLCSVFHGPSKFYILPLILSKCRLSQIFPSPAQAYVKCTSVISLYFSFSLQCTSSSFHLMIIQSVSDCCSIKTAWFIALSWSPAWVLAVIGAQ